MKRIIATILTIIMLFSMCIFSNAETVTTGNAKKVKIEELTETEYVEIVAKYTGKSESQIRNMLIAKEAEIYAEYGILSDETRHYRATTTLDFADGSAISMPVELGMAYTVHYIDNYAQIDSVDGCWTEATDSGPYTWNEFYNSYTDSGFPRTEIEAHARGAVEIAIDTSIAGQAELKKQLSDIGFSIEIQVGTVFYLRKVDNLDLYVDIYPN